MISPYISPGLAMRPELRKNRDLAKAEVILGNVCEYFGLSVSVVKSKTRKATIVYARYWAIWFIICETKLSLKEIGDFFGRTDHCLAIYARDSIKEQLTMSAHNVYKEDYKALCDMVIDGIKRTPGTPAKRVRQRKKIISAVKEAEEIIRMPIIRPRAVYTNTNFEKQVEDKYNQLAI